MLFKFWTLWNLALAVVPVGLGYAVAALANRHPRPRSAAVWVGIGALSLLWLAFLPNTCYLITEWRHFLEAVDRRELAVRAQDDHRLLLSIGAQGLVYAAYTGFGALALTLSIRPLERVVRRLRVPFGAVAPALFTLISLGVYLGLVLRLNSWDLWLRPGQVAAAIAAVPRYPLLMGTVLFFAVLLWMMYEAIDLWLDAAWERVGWARA